MHTRIMVAALTALLSFAAFADSANSYWPTWRGPQQTGAAVTGNPPTTWSETENVKWKVELPDAGDCTPIVWGDRIFIQTAVATKPDPDAKIPSQEEAGREIFTPTPTVPYVFGVLCLDRNTGETIWQKDLMEAIPHEGHHASSSFASYSPVTDGEHLWVSFGSRGLYCLDMDGNTVWQADFG
jgi:outer membrane protein assembly factor BamB